ncbi:DISARM system helicase DrmA [Actinomyces sp. HMT897]|uniref:DISARM system helicase DrmA n=1 Tax=Actinomyces sp. HMT897 TaxID=2789424 RepID=UPI00190C1454|nr:DISARM system helicase DrmA [Actinomyces sp. HMT897]QQO77750.1 helicase [Actinomyces sp. HMT897]
MSTPTPPAPASRPHSPAAGAGATPGSPVPSAAPGRRTQPPYELAHDLDGTSVSVRANLVDILRRELLGPADGADEILTVAPDGRYNLGRIAPTRLTGSAEAPRPGNGGDHADEGALDADALDARASTGVPVTGVDETGPDGDEDTAGDRDDTPIRRGLMIPASMGLRFRVPADLDALTVHASWGVYHPQSGGPTEDGREGGRPATVYRREDVIEHVRINPSSLAPGTTQDHVLREDVILRVDAQLENHAEGDRLLIEVALCNDRQTPRRIPTQAWLFQTRLDVDAGGRAVFLPVRDILTDASADLSDAEEARLALQYRDRLEFAVGRTCSADWTVQPGQRRATQVRTEWIPTSTTPQTDAATVDGALLDMTALATATPDELRAGLTPIIRAYGAWLDQQRSAIAALPDHLRSTAQEVVEEAGQVHASLAAGLDHLLESADAQRCFSFMNRVMADQRVHSQIAEERQKDPDLPLAAAEERVRAKDFPHHWRVFQLAFILLQILALTDPTAPRRSHPDKAKVELLFFPTGGGKTEAYLGLAAYAFAIRRLQGVLTTPDGPLDGGAGVTVLMRYTLRLLTSQQFQRATALVAAAEMARRKDPGTWGSEPFRIGLWVGSAVSPKRVAEAATQLKALKDRNAPEIAPYPALQTTRCPWCGNPLSYKNVRVDTVEGRVRVYCPDSLASCPFSEGGAVADGIPVLTTDEEIYRLVPAFVIATVDKLARLAREGQAAALFGHVARRCQRHGYVPQLDVRGTCDDDSCNVKSSHPAKNGMPPARVVATGRLRPPDLIIQDELHLITGALGTTVGLFEVAVDVMTTWRLTGDDGQVRTVRPLIVASSATVRNARAQVRGLYGRGLTVFPPQVLSASDTFFSTEMPIDEAHPGRLYLGLSTTGVKLTNAEIQTAQVLMAAGQLLLDRAGAAADPYMTLVGYFSATRELAGMARYVQDDVQTALAKGLPGSRLPRRYGNAMPGIKLGELTSRIDSTTITATLGSMALPFDPAVHSTAAREESARRFRAGHRPASRPGEQPYDAVLATSMLQVGVDVSRLGLMLIVGQPKNTAEYIQASSRVGRDPSRPGLVVTLGNWARPRDLAHYEQFRHFHETFYSQVEPLSVTPFSTTSLERGLDGLLVAAARVLTATDSPASSLGPEHSAGNILRQREAMDRLAQAIASRVEHSGADDPGGRTVDLLRARLADRIGQWERRAKDADEEANAPRTETGQHLVYERSSQGDGFLDLIRSAESTGPRSRRGGAPFVVANSMREVQPEINLLVSPDPTRLAWHEPDDAPGWQAQESATRTEEEE